MSPLQEFLMEGVGLNVEHEVIVSERLKDYPFKIRSLTLGEYNEVRKQSVNHSDESGQSDGSELVRNLVIAGCVDPCFKDAEYIQKSGCVTPAQVIDKQLLAGEVVRLSDEILRVSGFDKDINKLKKEAKN